MEYIRATNVTDDTMTELALVKRGYGSLAEIRGLDTPDFLDIVEFEQITSSIEYYEMTRK